MKSKLVTLPFPPLLSQEEKKSHDFISPKVPENAKTFLSMYLGAVTN